MNRVLAILTVLLAGALTFGLSGEANAASHVKSTVTTTAIYESTSGQAKQVKEWLMEHAGYVNGAMIGDLDKVGSVQVAYTYTSESAAGMARPMDANGPPVPLPPTSNPGDVISITSTSGGVTQTWSYTWVGNPSGGYWHLTKYTYQQNKPPTDPK